MPLSAPNQKFAVVYSHITIWSVIYGILIGHVPYFLGYPWSTCDNCSSKVACIVTLHGFDVTFSLFNLYVAWYGLKRLTSQTVSQYISLLGTALSVNLVFFCFECVSIINSLKAYAPTWQNLILASVATILLVACGLILSLKQKLIQANS